jgi:hypothetical protein
MMAITGYALHVGKFPPITTREFFVEKEDGIVEINIAPGLTKDYVGSHKAYLVTYDPVNADGVRWPDFKLRIRP